MASPSALFAAIDLAKAPLLVGVMRNRPLPPGVLDLIQIAAGSADALAAAALLVGKDTSVVHGAAVFYIRQVLWANGVDSYRILGVAPDAPAAKIAEHLRWYMKWLHPDSNPENVNRLYAARVLKAWDTLKTPERRRAYDESRSKGGRSRESRRKPLQLPSRRIPWIWRPRTEKAASWKQGVSIAAAVAAVVAVIAVVTGASDAMQEAIVKTMAEHDRHVVHFENSDPVVLPK